jgi:hypothetical protein
VFWVPAMSRESFELAYRDIGVRLQIPGIDNANANFNQLVKYKLRMESRPWLMVIDNADDSSILPSTTDTARSRLKDYT